MSLPALEKTLQDAIQQGNLAFTGPIVGSAPIGKLIERLYAGGTLDLSGAAVTLSGDKKTLTVSGTTDLVGIKAAQVDIALTGDDGPSRWKWR